MTEENDTEEGRTYLRIKEAIVFIDAHKTQQPSLKQVAEHVNLSEFHFQRLFSQWVGISPKQFLGFLTQAYAKKQLQNFSVLASAHASGLSGSSRLHDLMVNVEGITPGEYKKQGKGLLVEYGIHLSPFAMCLIAKTQRGICKLAFFDEPQQAAIHINELISEWPHARIEHNQKNTEPLVASIFDKTIKQDKPLNLLLKGTKFQLQVWQALLSIPEGGLCSYQQLAHSMGKQESVRAVASAIAKNKIALLIPCHRVIKGTGEFNQYRWGKDRKKIMIAHEAARVSGQ